PGARLESRSEGRFPNNAFLFELGAQGNPDTIRGCNFGRHLPGHIDNAGQIGNIVAAFATLRQVRVHAFRQRRQAVLLNCCFHILPPHDLSLQGGPLDGRPPDSCPLFFRRTCFVAKSPPRPAGPSVAQSLCAVCVFAAWRSSRACSRTSSWSSSRR